jgi:ATP-dependent DNA ligase
LNRHRGLSRAASRQHGHEVQLCAFDILVEGGDDLRKLPLHLRKISLQRLLARRPEGIFVKSVGDWTGPIASRLPDGLGWSQSAGRTVQALA